MANVNLIPDQNSSLAGAPPPKPFGFNRFPAARSLIIIVICVGCTCLLICMLFPCLQCFQRSNSNYFPENQEQNDDQEDHQADHGDKLDAIPVSTYRETTLFSVSTASSERETCVVCLGEYADTDIVKILPICKHMFHKHCIDHWLRVRSRTAPFVGTGRSIRVWNSQPQLAAI